MNINLNIEYYIYCSYAILMIIVIVMVIVEPILHTHNSLRRMLEETMNRALLDVKTEILILTV